MALFLLGTFSFTWWLGPGHNDMLQGYSTIVALFGIAMFCVGPAAMQVLWFPIFYLALGVKVSDRYWDLLAAQLRTLVAQGAVTVLHALQVHADLQGSVITVFPGRGEHVDLDVADACSGLRSLMAYIALGAAVAFISKRPSWQRWVLVAATIPVAVVVNIGRVSVTGLLAMVNPALSKGEFHTFVGMLMLVPALGLLLAVGWALDRFTPAAPSATGSLEAPSSGRAVPPGAGQDGLEGRRWWFGAAAGAALAALLGTAYALQMKLFRPDFIFRQTLSHGWTMGLLVAVALILLPMMWVAFRTIRGDSFAGLAGRSASLGVATGVLLVCVLGLNAMVRANGVVIFKDKLPLRHGLAELPATIGPWHRVRDVGISEAEREELGTTEAVSWLYQRTDTLDAMLVGLHLTYYTGIVDTVPHVPERCELARGAKELGRSTTVLHLDGPRYRAQGGKLYAESTLAGGEVLVPGADVPATINIFAQGRETYCVAYFFVANGNYFANPDGVRASGFSPWDRFNYYSKVQMRLPAHTPEEAAVQATELLRAVMPEVLACLPDWEEAQVVKSDARTDARGVGH
jgi:exosortase